MELDAAVALNYDELPLWSAPFGQLILDRVPLRRGQTVLDVGAGTGFLTVELAQRGAAVLTECHRVLRPSGRLVLSTNLSGHMREFYDVLRGVLAAEQLPKLDEHLAHRATVEGTVDRLTAAGFTDVAVDQGSFRMRFADGTALFGHYFVRLGFLDGWRAIAGADALTAVERELNRRGEVVLTVPTACFDARRP